MRREGKGEFSAPSEPPDIREVYDLVSNVSVNVRIE